MTKTWLFEKIYHYARVSLTACAMTSLGLSGGCALLNSFDDEATPTRDAGVNDLDASSGADAPSLDALDADGPVPADVQSDAHADGITDARGDDAGEDVQEPEDFAQLCAGLGYMGTDGNCVTAQRVASGTRHSCALMSDHSVWCWGSNEYGQLGRPAGSGADDFMPRKVHIISASQVNLTHQVLEVSAGAHHTCVTVNVPPTGQVRAYYCWGSNEFGQLGNGDLPGEVRAERTKIFAPEPVAMDKLSAAVGGRIVAGKKSTCATFVEGVGREDVRCWGANEFGQMGYGGSANLKPKSGEDWGVNPQPVWPVLDIYGKWVRAEHLSLHAEHVCLVGERLVEGEYVDQGHLWCWGRDDDFQLYAAPRDGNNHVISALDVEVAGKLRAWVDGNAETTYRAELEEVIAGRAHTCVRLRVSMSTEEAPEPEQEESSRMFCWGNNDFHQTQRSNTPRNFNEISLPPRAHPVVYMAAGDDFNCAVVGADRQLLCWGDNRSRQLGLENVTSYNADMGVYVPGGRAAQPALTGVQAMSAGAVHACALVETTLGPDAQIVNQVFCWGSNRYGQLGRSPQNPTNGCNEANAYYDCAHTPQPVQFRDETAN